jgi:hypothetical protein
MIEVRAVPRSRWSALLLLVLLAAGGATALSGCGQGPASGRSASALYPLMVHGEMCYVNRAGEVVIPREFNFAFPFSEGIAAVTFDEIHGGASGLIDATGQVVLNTDGGEFSEGLAAISDDDGFWTFVDRTGNVVLPGPYSGIPQPFVDGLAIIADPDTGGYGVIDTNGRWVVAPQYQQILAFSEGFAAVQGKDGLWGYVDKAGQMVVPPRFTDVDGGAQLYAYSADPSPAGPFSAGLAAVHTEAGWGFIDMTGAWVIPAQFEQAGAFAEGVAAVESGGLWGYVDRTGAWVVRPQYEHAAAFDQGVAVAESGGVYGLIDRTGAWVIPAQYKAIQPFSEGLAGVENQEDFWGYVDATGTLVIPTEYRAVHPFLDGAAVVRPEGNTEILVDQTGKHLTK